jgi:hypothetical protein
MKPRAPPPEVAGQSRHRRDGEAAVGVDLNGDGDTLDTVPGWRDNGSFLDTSNNGW